MMGGKGSWLLLISLPYFLTLTNTVHTVPFFEFFLFHLCRRRVESRAALYPSLRFLVPTRLELNYSLTVISHCPTSYILPLTSYL